MHKVVYGIAMASLGLAMMVILPHAAWSAPRRPTPPIDILTAEPFCAGCHAPVSDSHYPELQVEASKNKVYITKHDKVPESGVGRFRPLEPQQR